MTIWLRNFSKGSFVATRTITNGTIVARNECIPLVSNPYVNDVTLNGQNLYQKSFESSELKLSMLGRLRSFKKGTVGLCRSTGCKVKIC